MWTFREYENRMNILMAWHTKPRNYSIVVDQQVEWEKKERKKPRHTFLMIVCVCVCKHKEKTADKRLDTHRSMEFVCVRRGQNKEFAGPLKFNVIQLFLCVNRKLLCENEVQVVFGVVLFVVLIFFFQKRSNEVWRKKREKGGEGC